MPTSRASLVAIGGSAAIILALSGCASAGTATGTAPGEDDGALRIVASTDVYGDIVRQIVGDRAEVTSIIEGSAQDPHSYEASARDQLALSRADLVIQNGAGYDPFIDTLIADDAAVAVVDASESSGLPDAGDGFNEHVWYSLRGVGGIAVAIGDAVSELDPGNTAAYERGLDAFVRELDVLEARVAELAIQSAGAGVAITEPVPLYLVLDAGFVVATPKEFAEAVEEGSDVPPAVLRRALRSFDSGDVAFLAANPQTAGPDTERLAAAAGAAGVPIVDFTETLPEGMTYLTWMSANIDAIGSTLR